MEVTAHDTAEQDNPGIRFPPPFVYLIGLLIGVGLRYATTGPRFPEQLRHWIGAPCILLGLALSAAAMSRFRLQKTSVLPDHPATRLIVDGIFSRTRNPLYLAMLCFYIGGSFWFSLLWSLILAPAVVLVIQTQIIAREEAYLGRKFGQEYLMYKSRVRRWI